MLYIYDLHVQIHVLRYFPIYPYNAFFQELNS